MSKENANTNFKSNPISMANPFENLSKNENSYNNVFKNVNNSQIFNKSFSNQNNPSNKKPVWNYSYKPPNCFNNSSEMFNRSKVLLPQSLQPAALPNTINQSHLIESRQVGKTKLYFSYLIFDY